jgi:hypothetical protein
VVFALEPVPDREGDYLYVLAPFVLKVAGVLAGPAVYAPVGMREEDFSVLGHVVYPV